MADFDLKKLLIAKYSQPSITTWNRLESVPRTRDFSRGLKAEVRDAMWMLTRQWQFGEFQGEDAGSPVSAKVAGFHRSPDTLVLSEDRSFPYEANIPLEAMVEREMPQPTLRLRVQMGRMWQKMLRAAGFETANAFFIQQFPLPDFSADEETMALQFYTAVVGKVADGYALYQNSIDDLPGLIGAINGSTINQQAKSTIKQKLIGQFKEWFETLYFQPADGKSAWNDRRMEYDFKLDIPHRSNQKARLAADGYVGGRLDWPAFDLRHEPENVFSNNAPLPGEQKSDVFLPTQVSFKGMPHPRFWQMEEGNMDFGKIENSPAGLVGLLLAEYGLTYSNDWFLLPYLMKINNLCTIQGIVVTDVFGQKNFVAPSRVTTDTNWQEFALFHLTQDGRSMSRNQIFYLPPVVGAMLESEALEKVYFMRDEMANLVWAIEDIVPSQVGGGRKVLASEVESTPAEENANPDAWKYTLGTTVPENWIPFIAVHKKGAQTEIQLQRAKIPNAQPARSILLNEQQPVHFVEEEEVPRAGVIIERGVQRVRWLDGRTYCWVGRRKITGRGEGNSDLRFDGIE
ncbi:MAG: hypothetical protein DHS20C18_53530 [Saprospiraceae bacterium]|nr:MAG: hypothetical protein DHS20C18_53530 [Saprospiraceae bacterium]